MSLRFKHVVPGVDAAGTPIVSAGQAAPTHTLARMLGAVFHRVWGAEGSPSLVLGLIHRPPRAIMCV
jgi:hypothetical protein